MSVKTRRTIYIEVHNKLIPLGTASITYYEAREIYEVVLDKIDINVKNGDVLFSK